MPIPASTATTAMSIVNGLVRLAGRVDRVMTEEAALRSDLALPNRPLLSPPMVGDMQNKLSQLLQQTQAEQPDPLVDKRQQITDLVQQPDPGESELLAFMEEFLPDEVEFRLDDPDGDFVKKLRAKSRAWNLEEKDIQRAAFYLQPGDDLRESSLPWQIAMIVVDVLADIAVENQSLFLKDDRARPVLVAILQNFAEADLVDASSPKLFLRIVLRSTVNGTLDAADTLKGDKIWLNSLLGALAETRRSLGDDFVAGLLQGRGYPQLVGSLLEQGANRLASDESKAFEQVAGDVLKQAGALVKTRPALDGFFKEHWSDLLRAGLHSIHENGDAILGDESPLLRITLLSTLEVLGDTEGRDFITSDTLANVVDTAVSAVTIDASLLDDGKRKDWLRQLVESTISVIKHQGAKRTFGPDGVDLLLQTVFKDISGQPELLLRKPGLFQDVIGGLLDKLADSETPRLKDIAVSAVQTVLKEIGESPELADTHYAALVTEITGGLADSLGDLKLSRQEAGKILNTVAASVAGTPSLLIGENTSLTAQAVVKVLAVLASNEDEVINVRRVNDLVVEILDVVAIDPQLFASKPELLSNAISAILNSIRETLASSQVKPDLRFSRLAEVSIRTIMKNIASNPSLIKIEAKYTTAVGHLSAELARHLQDGRLAASEVEAILYKVGTIIAENSGCLAGKEHKLVGAVVSGLIEKAVSENGLNLRGESLSTTIQGVLKVVAAHGKLLQVDDDPLEILVKRVQSVFDAIIDTAKEQLGQSLNQQALPAVIIQLFGRWANDEVFTLDITDAHFKAMFKQATAEAMAIAS